MKSSPTRPLGAAAATREALRRFVQTRGTKRLNQSPFQRLREVRLAPQTRFRCYDSDMASEISGGGSNNQDTSALQEQYQKRRQEIVERNEAQLKKIQSDYTDKKNGIKEQGEAAVNHTKKYTAEQIEQMRRSHDERLKTEESQLANRYETQKKSGDGKIEGLERHLESQKENLSRQAQMIRERQSEFAQNENQQTSELSKKHNLRRQDIEREASKGIEQTRGQSIKARGEILGKYRDELSALDAEHAAAMQKTKVHTHTELEKTRSDGTKRVQNLQQSQSQQYEKERHESLKSLDQLRDTVQTEKQTQREQADAELAGLRANQTLQQKDTREQGQKELAEANQYYQKETAKQHKAGDQALFLTREQQQKKTIEQKQIYKKEHEELTTRQLAEKEKLQQNHNAEMERNQMFYRQGLAGQKQEFDESFVRNQEFSQQALDSQYGRLVNQLEEQKKDTLQHVGKYSDKRSDPFYNLQAPSTRFREEGGYYIIETEAPEHEKDNIDIRVKADKVIVSGKRAFEDDVKAADRRISTNSYQTFREEIPLAKPVVEKLAEKTYANGILRVKIPKIG